jgi:hypothetical protein
MWLDAPRRELAMWLDAPRRELATLSVLPPCHLAKKLPGY